MNQKQDRFYEFAQDRGLSEEQTLAIWQYFNSNLEKSKNFLMTSFYFLGAFVLLISFIWFFGFNEDIFSKKAYVLNALLIYVTMSFVGFFLFKKNKNISGKLILGVSVYFFSIFIYFLQDFFGYKPDLPVDEVKTFKSWIEKGYFFIFLFSFFNSAIVFYFTRSSFVLSAVLLYGLSIVYNFVSLTIICLYKDFDNLNAAMFAMNGIISFLLGLYFDKKKYKNYNLVTNFLVVLSTFGWTFYTSFSNEYYRFISFLVYFTLFVYGSLKRKIVILIGSSVGILGYFTVIYLIHFLDSKFFPFLLGGIGFFTVFLTYFFEKKKNRKMELRNS
jgi:hypothetical protein